MKKIIVLLFLICAIPLSACSKAPEQIPAPTVQRLTSPLELSEDEAATLIPVSYTHLVAVIASINGEKITFLAVCGKEAVARGIKAGDLVRHVSAICGGNGGGMPDSAMGGGSDLLKVDDALASVDDFVSEKQG